MLIDTHAHLNFNAYKNDVDEVIRRSLENHVWMINVGSNYITSKRATEIAEKYPEGVYAAIGVHPIHLAEGIFKVKLDEEEQVFQTKNEDFNYEEYKNLAVGKSLEDFVCSKNLAVGKNLDSSGIKNLTKNKKVVAIGEIGLDYYYRPKTKIKLEQFKIKQKEIFLVQLKLAEELNLPVIFHCRMAHEDLIKILNEQKTKNKKQLRGVVHCFTGDWKQAQQYLEMGFYLGFNGIIFKLNLDEVIEKTPLDEILIETDCPYLTPPQKNGRNEPLYVKHIVEKIAKIKNLSYEEITEITTENAKKLFKIYQ